MDPNSTLSNSAGAYITVSVSSVFLVCLLVSNLFSLKIAVVEVSRKYRNMATCIINTIFTNLIHCFVFLPVGMEYLTNGMSTLESSVCKGLRMETSFSLVFHSYVYLAILLPRLWRESTQLSSVKSFLIISLLIWVASIMFTVPAFVIIIGSEQTFNGSDNRHVSYNFPEGEKVTDYFVLCLLMTGFVIPILVFIFLQPLIHDRLSLKHYDIEAEDSQQEQRLTDQSINQKTSADERINKTLNINDNESDSLTSRLDKGQATLLSTKETHICSSHTKHSELLLAVSNKCSNGRSGSRNIYESRSNNANTCEVESPSCQMLKRGKEDSERIREYIKLEERLVDSGILSKPTCAAEHLLSSTVEIEEEYGINNQITFDMSLVVPYNINLAVHFISWTPILIVYFVVSKCSTCEIDKTTWYWISMIPCLGMMVNPLLIILLKSEWCDKLWLPFRRENQYS